MQEGAEGPQADPLDTVTLDAPVAESAESVPPEGTPAPAAEAPPAELTPETPDAAPPAKDAGPDTASAIPTQTFTPPTGEPFTLRVERNAIPIEGAVLTPDKGVYFPPEAWRKVQSNYLGDRRVWQQERQQYEARVREVEQGKSEKELQADALLATMNELLDPKNRDDLIARIEDWDRQAPILRAQAEAKALAAERDRLAEQVRQREEAEERARVIPEMQHWLGEEVEKLLASDDFKGLFEAQQPAALLRELWDHHAQAVFYEGKDGRIHLDRDRLTDLIESRAQWVRQARVGMQKVEQKKAANAAALAPTKPGVAVPAKPHPKVEKPRDEKGKFVRQDPDEWEREFMATEYSKHL